jgi:hypothetical protein
MLVAMSLHIGLDGPSSMSTFMVIVSDSLNCMCYNQDTMNAIFIQLNSVNLTQSLVT